jgi:hypothetical protein
MIQPLQTTLDMCAQCNNHGAFALVLPAQVHFEYLENCKIYGKNILGKDWFLSTTFVQNNTCLHEYLAGYV